MFTVFYIFFFTWNTDFIKLPARLILASKSHRSHLVSFSYRCKDVLQIFASCVCSLEFGEPHSRALFSSTQSPTNPSFSSDTNHLYRINAESVKKKLKEKRKKHPGINEKLSPENTESYARFTSRNVVKTSSAPSVTLLYFPFLRRIKIYVGAP